MTPVVIEAIVALLLCASGAASVVAGLGLVRLPSFFLRMHPPAVAATFGVWAVALASTLVFSFVEGMPVLHAWVIPLALAVTTPMTTVLLARAALFRRRQQGAVDVPPPLR